ncbi:MAG: toxic anion resistance protein, partial [Olsenella sp.]|nr:toxic anion resistance protein [Olsenella sp.]
MADSTQDFDMDIPEPELEFGDPTPTTPDPAPAAVSAPAPANDPAQTLSPAEREKVEAFVEKIDITDTASVLSYGVGSQRKVSEFSERALDGVRNNDLGEIGDDISSLIVTLKDFDPDKQEKSGPLAIFHKAKNSLEALRTRYTAVEKNVREISDTLEGHQRTLLKDIATLDQLYA